MDRNLPLKPTLAFLTCLILSIGVFLYFAPLTTPSPISQLFKSANGQLTVVEKDHLVTMNEAPESIDLSAFVQGAHVGQMIPLASGELILNARGQSQNIWLNLKRLFRVSDSSHQTGTSLLKCDGRVLDCQSWGSDGLIFNMGWSGLALENGQVIINDSSRHRVLLLSAEGELLSELGGFKFPNHAVEVDSKIWIVDTNHHQLVAIKIENNQLSRTGETIRLSDYDGIEPQHSWPSIAYLDAEGLWWVMANDNNMAYPGIYRLNKDKTVTRIAKQISDATAMLLHQQQLYVASYPENAVWAFDIQTLSGDKINNRELQRLNQSIQQQVAVQNRTMWGMIIAIVLVGFSFLAYAVKRSTPVERTSGDDLLSEAAEAAAPHVSGIVWVDKQPKFAKKMKMAQRSITLMVPLLLVLVLIGFATLFLGGGNDSWRLLGTLAVLVLVVVLVRTLVMRSTEGYTEYDLGVENNHLVIRHIKSDKKTIILSNQIEFTQYAFCAGKFYFPYQHHQLGSAYNPQQFKQYVVPLFKQGSKITEWAMFTRLLKSKKYDPR